MSVSVTFPESKDVAPAKGTAGLATRLGGACTTVSAIEEAGKATENAGLIKKHIG